MFHVLLRSTALVLHIQSGLAGHIDPFIAQHAACNLTDEVCLNTLRRFLHSTNLSLMADGDLFVTGDLSIIKT